MSTDIALSPSNLTAAIKKVLAAGLVPYIVSSPGMGKTSIIHSIAKEASLEMIDIRLGQCDPTDLNGFATIDSKTSKAKYLPFDHFPLEGAALPKGKNGWLIFFDELPTAAPAVQAAAYKILLERMIGQKQLHPDVYIVAAGNRVSDNAHANNIGTATQSRLITLELKSNLPDWLDWAVSNGIDHRITAFLNFMPDKLNNFSPKHSEFTFPCERTWEFASRLIKGQATITFNDLPLLSGAIGQGAAHEFIGYCRVYKELPEISDIENSPQHTPVPTEPSAIHAVVGYCASKCTAQNFAAITEYLERIPAEFMAVGVQRIIRSNPEFTKLPTYGAWLRRNATRLTA